jgi:hypothetical protein
MSCMVATRMWQRRSSRAFANQSAKVLSATGSVLRHRPAPVSRVHASAPYKNPAVYELVLYSTVQEASSVLVYFLFIFVTTKESGHDACGLLNIAGFLRNPEPVRLLHHEPGKECRRRPLPKCLESKRRSPPNVVHVASICINWLL